MKTFKTFLPLFPGFYGTLLEPQEDNEIDYINEQREVKGLKPVNFDNIKFDYSDYFLRVSRACVGFVEKELNYIIPCKIEFEELISPKEYNFTNDSINVSIEIEQKAVLNYFLAHKEQLKQYFKDNYTSRSGFTSFYSANIDEWIEDLQSQDFGSVNTHKMGACLEAILLNELSEDIQILLYEAVSGEMYISAINFDELTTI